MVIEILAAIATGYLIGSIPFALVVGKIFFNTDVRNYGSGNLGGSNAGRVLGKKAGLSVMALDLLKVTFVIFLASFLKNREIVMVAAGVTAAVGHCFPIFAKFKGGKAVATMYGFLFGMALIGGYSFWIFFVPLLTFLAVLYITKIVALSSVFSAIVNTLFIYFVIGSKILFLGSLVFTIVMIIRHRANFERMLKHEENKISWM